MEKKIMDLIPKALREDLIKEVKEILKERGVKNLEDEPVDDSKIEDEIKEWSKKK